MMLNKKEQAVIYNFLENASCVGLDGLMVNHYNWEHNYHLSYPEDKVTTFAGCTKVVVVFDELDWVLKIPMLEERPWDTSHPEPFDHCAREARNYRKAQEEGLAEYFAPTFFFTNYEGFPIYVQKKMNCDVDRVSDSFRSYVSGNYNREDFENEEDYNDAIESDSHGLDDDESLEAVFGEDYKLGNFILDNDINDLHCGNFGFNPETGAPVLIDFSGYNSWDPSDWNPAMEA